MVILGSWTLSQTRFKGLLIQSRACSSTLKLLERDPWGTPDPMTSWEFLQKLVGAILGLFDEGSYYFGSRLRAPDFWNSLL